MQRNDSEWQTTSAEEDPGMAVLQLQGKQQGFMWADAQEGSSSKSHAVLTGLH